MEVLDGQAERMERKTDFHAEKCRGNDDEAEGEHEPNRGNRHEVGRAEIREDVRGHK